MDQNPLKENEDFYLDELGLMVLTKEYLLKKGYCCENGCRHCPYGYLGHKKTDVEKEFNS